MTLPNRQTGGALHALAIGGLLALAPVAAHAADDTPTPASPALPAASPASPETAAQPEAAQEASPSAGDETPAEKRLEQRVKELEETVRKLQGTIEQLQGKPLPREPLTGTVAPLPGKGRNPDERPSTARGAAGGRPDFIFSSPDGDFKLRFGGLIQTDARIFTGGQTGPDTYLLRRLRPILEGTVYKYFDFRVMPDFGEGKTSVQDAYLEYVYNPRAQLRVGKYKEPLSLERLQADQDLTFPERSIANTLAPNRDIGFQLSGDVFHGKLGYQLGIFNGVNDFQSSDADTGNGKDFVGRIFARPWRNQTKSPLEGLGFGVSGSYGPERTSLANLVLRTSPEDPFFQYAKNATGGGDRRRLDPQFYYYRGPLGLMGEEIWSSQQVKLGNNRGDFTNSGGFLQASYVLTGEKAGYRGVVPKKPFDPKLNHWGAFEVAARVAHIDVDPDIFDRKFADPTVSAKRASEFTFGVNWYLNQAIKIALDWEHTDFDHRITVGGFHTDHEDLFYSRFQIAF